LTQSREPIGSRHVLDRDPKGLGHRSHRPDAVGCPLAEEIEILRGRSGHEPAEDKIAATDENDLAVERTCREQVPESLERGLELGSTDCCHAATLEVQVVRVNLANR
jgi:hypothetical protein